MCENYSLAVQCVSTGVQMNYCTHVSGSERTAASCCKGVAHRRVFNGLQMSNATKTPGVNPLLVFCLFVGCVDIMKINLIVFLAMCGK